MPRPNRPWYRKSRVEWFVTINGKQYGLKVYDENAPWEEVEAAWQAKERELGANPAGGNRATVSEAVRAFLGCDRVRALAPDTRANYTHRLGWFVRHFGRRLVETVTPDEVEAKAGAETWSDGTVRLTLTAVQLAVRHAGRAGFSLIRPAMPVRDERCVISREEYQQALGECHGDYGPLVQTLFLTGRRPKEVRLLTVEQVNWETGKATLEAHKTRKRTGRPATVYLSAAALAVLKGQADKYGSGHLFRNARGRPFSAASVQTRWRLVREKLGLRRQVIPGSMRHSFASHLLEAGASTRDVAELLGHTSTTMVEKIYGKFLDHNRLREVAAKVTG